MNRDELIDGIRAKLREGHTSSLIGPQDETLTEARSTCVECEREVFRYCHSQAGSLKAYAWSDIYPDGPEDPRYGTRCPAGDLLSPHRPESEGCEAFDVGELDEGEPAW